jgi:glycosyltransferase involved in cell wall biosynthesis
VPVVAYAATAVPETLGGGGLLLPDKSPAVVAAAVDRVVRDAPLRARLAAAGAARLGDFALARTSAILADAVAELLGEGAAAAGVGA